MVTAGERYTVTDWALGAGAFASVVLAVLYMIAATQPVMSMWHWGFLLISTSLALRGFAALKNRLKPR